MNTLNDALKPCPFCGITPSFEHIEIDANQGYKWGRVRCCIEGPEVRTNYDESENAPWKAEAIAAWNTRANTPDSVAHGAMRDAQMRCDQCGGSTCPIYGGSGSVMCNDCDHIQDILQPSDATAQPSAGNWQQYAKEGESAQDVIERERGDCDALLTLLAKAREVAQPRVDLTDEQIDTKWLSVSKNARHASILDVRTFARALLANTAQGKPEHSELDAARFNALRELATLGDGANEIMEQAEKLAALPNEERNPTADDFNAVADAIANALAAKKG